jgi:hypothetical protein
LSTAYEARIVGVGGSHKAHASPKRPAAMQKKAMRSSAAEPLSAEGAVEPAAAAVAGAGLAAVLAAAAVVVAAAAALLAAAVVVVAAALLAAGSA